MATSSKTLRRRQADIAAFAESLSNLLAVLQPSEGSFGGYPTLYPQAGREQEAARRAGEVDRVAGRAAVALQAIGGVIDWKPRGAFDWQTIPVNPASAWQTILARDPHFPPGMILGVCTQAIGVLDAFAIDAGEHEESLAGKIERVARIWPRRAGIEKHGKIVAGALLTLGMTLLAAYLTYRFGWGDE